MLQDQITIDLRHEQFIKKVCETEIVWGLENNEGFATSSSNKGENSNSEVKRIICFWSEKALAKSCIKEDWEGYQTVETILSNYIENWCFGMFDDGLLAGLNFNQNMFGYEIEPLDLILELSKEIENQSKDIKLQNFSSLKDLVKKVKVLKEI